jgi:hypothetical protein
MGRSALFGDAAVVKRLSTEFIPYAGDRQFLERSLGDWWSTLVQTANPRHPRGMTTQGSYVVGWDGTAYAFDNYNRDSRRFSILLDRGIAGFKRTPPAGHARADTSFTEVCKISPLPSDVSVIGVFARIRPLPSGADAQNSRLGRDTMWIYDDEAREILRSETMPRTLAARIVLFHILDNVRGQVVPWQPRDVRQCDFSLKKLEPNQFAFHGKFLKQGSTAFFSDRGHEGAIDGALTIDPKTSKVTRFRAYSAGVAWGKAPYARPDVPPAGRYPLVIGMKEVVDASKCVLPAGAGAGDGYRHPR